MKKKFNLPLEKFYKYPLILIIVICVITIVLGFQMKNLVIDNDTSNFLPKDNPSRLEYKIVEDTYGGNMIMAIGIKLKDGYVYQAKNLKILSSIVSEIEKIPNINKVTSIIDADYIKGTDSGIETEKMIDKIPENVNEENLIKDKLNSWKIYKGTLFSKDYKSTMIAIKLQLGVKNAIAENTYRDVKKIIGKYESSGYEFHVAGLPSILVVMAESLRDDMSRLIPFVLIILILTLYLSFRKVSGILLPTITVLITTVCTLGLMAVCKINLTMVGSAIPTMMIAVGSAYGIHILSHYYDEIEKEFQKTDVITVQRNKEIIFHTIKRIGWAVFLAALTTIGGFGSLATSNIIPLREFGIFTAIGVLIAFIIALIFIPSVLILSHKNIKKKISKKQNIVKEGIKKDDIITRILLSIYNFFIKSKVRVIILCSVILLVAIIGTMQLVIGNPMVNYFRNTTEIRKSDNFANTNFNGTTNLELVVRGKGPGSLTNPEILKSIDDLSRHLETKYSDIGAVMSFADLVKKMNQVMNTDESGDYYEIPYIPAKYNCKDKAELKQLIAQYLLLFSGNISDYVDDPIEPSQTKITVMLRNPDFDYIRDIKKDIETWTKANFPPDYTISVTGNAILQVVVSDLIIDSQISNIISSLIAVFLILALYYRSMIAGVFGIVTLAIPIFLNFGLMGFFGVRLDAGTAMVASVAIGIGIDYTIHFMNAYHHERKLTTELELVTKRALTGSGRAIIFNALAVAFGFIVFAFSNFMPLVSFGILISVTMFTSSFASMTLLPVLLNLFKPKFISK